MDIEILGRITRVNCPAGQEQALQTAADELNRRLDDMKKRTQVNNAEQLLAIAALNAFYELDSLTKEAEKTQVISEKLSKMSKVLDDALDAVITKPFKNKQAISPVNETATEQNNATSTSSAPVTRPQSADNIRQNHVSQNNASQSNVSQNNISQSNVTQDHATQNNVVKLNTPPSQGQ